MASPRIIAGIARGFRLKSVPGNTTRPVTDRVKEALFNILNGDILDARFLDLFGGTGSIGLEALSRGAGRVVMIDMERRAVEVIRQNLQLSGLPQEKAQVYCQDAFRFLKSPVSENFDYIYIAPPQYKGLWLHALEILDSSPERLAEDGQIIVQIDPVEFDPPVLTHFTQTDLRRYGSTLLIFYEYQMS